MVSQSSAYLFSERFLEASQIFKRFHIEVDLVVFPINLLFFDVIIVLVALIWINLDHASQ